MNRYCVILCLCLPLSLRSQEQIFSENEQQLENIAETKEETEVSDDSWWQHLEYLKENPLNLNAATRDELIELQLMSAFQVEQFLQYRKLLGHLISIYELQSVPGWDLFLIRKLVPYVVVKEPALTKTNLLNRFNSGNISLGLRYSRVIEKAKGYLNLDSTRTAYHGDPSKVMVRFKYAYKNLLQYGITLAKDAGEPLLIKQPGAFDFVSYHLFARNIGILKSLAVGDYTINLGQGLIHWQGLSFGSDGDITHIKKQSTPIRPYNSSGAFHFHRGAAVAVEKYNWQATAFFSLKNIDARINPDSSKGDAYITSIHTSGYHRTQSEKRDQATARLFAYGASLRYKMGHWYIAANMIRYHFNYKIQKEPTPYNLYALRGKDFGNYSIDYGFTVRNMHVFGEFAIDDHFRKATINGVLISVHPRADFSLLHRSFSKSYQAYYSNAFAVNSSVTNEQGIFAGFSLRPFPAWSINLSADIFRFPWLKYRTDAPSSGKDYFVQLHWKYSKQTEVYSRYRSRRKMINQSSETNAMNEAGICFNRSWRTQISHRLNSTFSIRQRFEMLWYSPEKGSPEKGFLAFFDVFFKPPRRNFSFNLRLQYFDSESYNSRLYAFENDVRYYYSVPVFYDKGTRYYINARYKLNKHISLWLKWGQTIYSNKDSVGSGLDEIGGNKKSEIRLLLSAMF